MMKGERYRTTGKKKKKRRKGIKKRPPNLQNEVQRVFITPLDRALELTGQDWSERQETVYSAAGVKENTAPRKRKGLKKECMCVC